MRITDLLKKQGISLGASPQSKREAIDLLVDLHAKCGNLNDVAAYKEGILAREGTKLSRLPLSPPSPSRTVWTMRLPTDSPAS